MTESKLHLLRAELDEWRARIQHLRVKANLGGKELRDKLRDLGERLEPAHRRAQEQLSRLAREGAGEAKTLARSLKAGWDELLRTHKELTQEAEHERASRG